MSRKKAFFLLMKREVKDLLFSGRCGQVIAFQASAVVIFSLALGHDPLFLEEVAPSLLWILNIFVQVFTYDSLFQQERQQGMNDLFLISSSSLHTIVLCKALAHVLTLGVPLIAFIPVWGVFLGLGGEKILRLCTVLFLGGLALTFMGMMLGVMLCHIKRTTLLMGMLLLPLLTPVIIVGTIALYTEFPFPLIVLFLLSCGFVSLAMLVAPWCLRHQPSWNYDRDR